MQGLLLYSSRKYYFGSVKTNSLWINYYCRTIVVYFSKVEKCFEGVSIHLYEKVTAHVWAAMECLPTSVPLLLFLNSWTGYVGCMPFREYPLTVQIHEMYVFINNILMIWCSWLYSDKTVNAIQTSVSRVLCQFLWRSYLETLTDGICQILWHSHLDVGKQWLMGSAFFLFLRSLALTWP